MIAVRRRKELREALAALEHDRWSRWMKYQLMCGTFNADGSWTMPAALVNRWTRQMAATYATLTEREQASDLAEADRTLGAIDEHLLRCIVEYRRKTSGE